MSDAYNFIFSDDPRTGTLTASQLEARRKIAIALATRNRPYPKTIGEGLTALGEGIGEGMYNRDTMRAEAASQKYNEGISRDLSGGTVAPRPAPGGASLEGDPNAAVADATETKQPLTPAQASQQPQMPIEEWLQRVARNESGSRKDAYTLVGERSRRGDYPYGKYQVMGENVPVWTAKYLGKEMTPQEFLADKDAQEQVARGRGSEYLAKYGPEGAAAAWFAGEKGMNDPNRKDTLGTHVAEYRRRFNIPLVSRDQVVASAARAPVDPEDAAPYQVAALGGGVPTPDTAPDPREAVAQTLTGPPLQQVAQAGPVGPTPSPVPPNAVPRELTPQAVPPAPAQSARPPEPGPRPEPGDYIRANPQLARQMQRMREIIADERADPQHRLDARDQYNKLEQRANEADKNAFTIWHENTTKKRDWELGAEQRNLATSKARGEVYDAAEKRALSDRLGGRDPEKFFTGLDQEKDAVSRQGHMLSQIAFAESAINAGVISGFGADARINFAAMRAWMFNNKIEGDLASNTQRLQAAAKSMLGQAVQNIQGKDPRVSEGDIKVASGTIAADPSYQLETMKKILQDNKRVAIRSINDYEDKVDHYLAGHRSERNYQLPPIPTDTSGRYTQRLLEHRNNDEAKKEYDKHFGEGAAELELARAKRRERRGG